MKRNFSSFIMVLLTAILLVGCTQNQEISTEGSTNGEAKSEASSNMINAVVDNSVGNSSTSIINEEIQGLELKEKFLNSIEGRNFQAVTWRFAKAYLSSDVNSMKLYMIDPKSKIDSYNVDAFDNVELLILKLAPEDIKEEMVTAEYEIGLKGQDTLIYLYIEMRRVNNEWKVQNYGLEQ